MTTANDGGQHTTTAGQVLPEIPKNPHHPWECIVSTERQWTDLESACIQAYGRQCAEHVAGPLREELTAVLSDWNALVQAIGSPTNGGAVAHAKALQKRVSELEQQNEGLRQQHDRDSFSLRSLCEHRDHLKSECEAKGQRVAELEREEEVTDHVIERTTRLLAECVVILRGPEPPLTKWSYHDIPQLVQALKDDRDRLRAENQAKDAVIADFRRLAAEIGQALDGAGAATAPSLCDLIEPARKLRMQHDMLRAESVIEWEPGRSYTAAELLRRAIRGITVRKSRPLWPAVMNLCGLGSNAAHHLCRWAGRDPDTGATIEGKK
jgi:hypothetical protein